MFAVMRSLLALAMFPLLCLCATFMRDDCWCRNATHIAWNHHLQLFSENIPGPMLSIEQWCIDETADGHGECLNWHTKQYSICASYQAHGDKARRNDFCFKNHGNSRGILSRFSKGPDVICMSFYFGPSTLRRSSNRTSACSYYNILSTTP